MWVAWKAALMAVVRAAWKVAMKVVYWVDW
jgi:hypothetical protein